MWTHKRPFRRPKLTLESIEGQGKIYLYRSLNIKRVIGIIGSGVSSGYGLPSWAEMTTDVIIKTKDILKEYNNNSNQKKQKELPQYLNDYNQETYISANEAISILETCRQIVMDIELENTGQDKDKDKDKDKLQTEITTKIKMASDKVTKKELGDSDKSPIKAIFEELRIRRFLTLNYDVLIEKYLQECQKFECDDRGQHGFEKLFNPPSGLGDTNLDLRLKAYNSLGRTALSICMDPETIGDLINFSSFPFAHEAQIYHLHGRVDHPKSLIVTESDYQQLYIQSDNQRRTFNEALDMLFTGNDILFIGIGMGEDDALRPLRRFALQERDRIWSARRVFALLPFEGKAKSEITAIKLKTRYNVHAIFYRHSDKKLEKTENILITKGEFEEREKTKTTSNVKAKKKTNQKKKEDDELYYKDDLAEFLTHDIQSLTQGNRNWWQDWQKLPKQRVAIYANYGEDDHQIWTRHRTYFTPLKGDSALFKKTVKWSQKIAEEKTCYRRILRVCAPTGYGKGSLHLELQGRGKIKQLFHEDEEYYGAFFAHTSFSVEFPSVIAALNRFLAFHIQKLKGRDEGKQWKAAQNPTLVGAWEENENLHRLKQLKKLLDLFTSEQKAGKKNRLFICLTGLDLITNKYGDGYSPCNREFFRILTKHSVVIKKGIMEPPPLDILLIAGCPETPIRYLSEECEKERLDECEQGPHLWADTAFARPFFSHKNNETPAKPPFLKKWHTLPPLPYKERDWLGCAPTRVNKKEIVNNYPNLYRLLEKSVFLDSLVSYCVDEIIGALPKNKKSQAVLDWLARLEQSASRTGSKEVLSEIFKQYRAINSNDDNLKYTYTLRMTILRHLSLFRIPVTSEVLYSCDYIKKEIEKALDNLPTHNKRHCLSEALKRLEDRGLLIPVFPGITRFGKNEIPVTVNEVHEKEQARYILHPQMREFIASQMDFSIPARGERNYYEVSVYAVQPHDLPTPNETHFQFVHDIIRQQLEDCRKNLALFYDPKTNEKKIEAEKFTPQQILAIPQQIRAVYSIVRETFSVATLSRLDKIKTEDWELGEPFEIYRIWLGGILHAATGVEELKNYYDDPKSKLANKVTDYSYTLANPLYLFEIVWLLNERGVAELVQGHLYDAYAVFEHAIRVNSRFETSGDLDDVCHATERRIQLNKAIVLIERARIDNAQKILSQLVKRIRDHPNRTPSVTYALAQGYLGLCAHLTGHFKEAEHCYKSVIKYCSSNGNLRAVSIFRRHYADLLRATEKMQKARDQLQLSILAASHEEQKDVLHLALVSKARLERTDHNGDNVEAVRILEAAMDYGRKMGITKIQVEALKVRAEINMIQGETEFAGRLAAQAIGLANRHGMRLREISTLLLYGTILAKRDQRALAISTIKGALGEAEKYGYQLKAQQAQSSLRDLGREE
ncbi:MAG: SIR2 family protein [Hyphomicrobiaceae bacterium]|nr:SIR2 family protein [Hyphomicrobiaceae bacterium]